MNNHDGKSLLIKLLTQEYKLIYLIDLRIEEFPFSIRIESNSIK